MVSLEKMRKQYTIDELNRDQLLENPTDMFRKWFEEVEALDDIEPNAMALATASEKAASLTVTGNASLTSLTNVLLSNLVEDDFLLRL
mgnify:CR=1 FL=1